MKFRIVIEYCPVAAGYLGPVGWHRKFLRLSKTRLMKSLKPRKDKSGVFQIACNQELIWCRERDKGFPNIKELKQRIRDYVSPEKELGHIDRT